MRILIAAASIALLAVPAHADLSISGKPTQHVRCSGGTCTASAAKAVLNAGDLQTMLASGDVTVSTGKSANNIVVGLPLSWSSANRLTLSATQSISVKKPVVVTGAGGLTLNTGASGDFTFSDKGHVEFQNLNSSLIINGNSYVLGNTLAGLSTAINNNLSGFFALANSYDASKDGTYAFAPLSSFFGTFEGLGNTVQRLSVHLGAHGTQAGLFGCACPGSVLRDMTITGANIRGTDNADNVGVLAGVSYGTVAHVRVSGSARGGGSLSVVDRVGGLLGLAHGMIIDSHSSAKVSNGTLMGGLIASLDPAGDSPPTIIDSSATGDIVGVAGSGAGGLVGSSGNNFTTEIIENSFATGSITISGCNLCGGLVGLNAGAISNSYATGAVTASGCGACGGLVGSNSGGVTLSYSTGAVVATGGTAGGSIGKDLSAAGRLSNAYWDTDTTGISDPSQGAGNVANDPGLTGLNDEQLKSGLPSGFDPSVWAQDARINSGYPYLLANPAL